MEEVAILNPFRLRTLLAVYLIHWIFEPESLAGRVDDRAATLVGQSLGARRPDFARRYGRRAVWISGLATAAMGVIFYTVQYNERTRRRRVNRRFHQVGALMGR